MEHDGPLSQSQVPATHPCPNADQSISRLSFPLTEDPF